MVNKKLVIIIAIVLSLVLATNVAITIGAFSKIESLQKENSALLSTTETLTEKLSRASSLEVSQRELSSKLDKLIADNEALKADLKKLKARPTSVVHSTSDTGGERIEVITSSDSSNTPNDNYSWVPDSYDYRTNNGLLVAAHRLNREQKSLSTTSYNLELDSVAVVSSTETGQQVAHVQNTITSSGEPDNHIPLISKRVELIYENPQHRKMLIAPHLNLGAGAGVDFSPTSVGIHGSIGISLFAYGKTVNDNTLRFLNINGRLGSSIRGGSQPPCIEGGIGLDPLLVNIGEPLPLLSDLYIGIGPWIGIRGCPESDIPTVSGGITIGLFSTL